MKDESGINRREALSLLIKGSAAALSATGLSGLMAGCGGGGGGSGGSGTGPGGGDGNALKVSADFAQIHPQPLLKSRLGFAQNLHTLGAGLEGTVPYLVALGACGFNGACEFDGWFKWGAATPNLCMVATYDSHGRAITMQPYPSIVATQWVSLLNAAGMRCGIELVGATPETQPDVAAYGASNPAPVDIAAHCAKIVAWTRGDLWPAPVDWHLWNEPGHSLNGAVQGYHDDGSQFAETDADYAIRRSQRRQQARDILWQLYAGTFLKTTPVIGKWATVSCGPLLAGDTQTGNGRALPDGSSFRYAWWSTYAADFNASSTLPNTYAVANDFGNRGATIFGSEGDFQGQDWPALFTQGGPSLLKSSDPDGGDGGDPASDTRMGPACEMLTMLTADASVPELALRHWSYWLGGKDGFLSNDGAGGYLQRHRYTAMKLWTSVPTRRVALSGTSAAPVDDGNQYGLQGLLGVAGVDPGGQSASILLWNETAQTVVVAVSTANLPARLQAVGPSTTILDEDHPSGITAAWDGSNISLAPRTAWLATWSATGSPEARRQPYSDGIHTPTFLRRVDGYKRPKGAAAYFDQVRGVAWIMPVMTYTGTIATGAAWSDLPDSLWITWWAWAVDVPTLPITVTCDYGSGPVELLTTTAAAISAGQVVELPIAARAPAGWTSGARTGDLRIGLTGASAMRLEAWFSGTKALANAVNA